MASRTLSRDEFNAIHQQVIDNAPPGLSREEFDRYYGPAMAQAIGTAENLPTAPEGSAFGRFVSNAASVLNPVAAVEGVYQAVRHPVTTTENLIGAQVGQGRQALSDVKRGRYAEAVGHGAAALLPLVGPAAAQTGEQIGSGDVAGGLGRGTALALAPTITEGALKLGKNLLQRGSLRLMQSALKPSDALVNTRRAAGFPTKQAVAQAVLDERRIITPRSLAKAQDALDATDAAAQQALTQGAGAGVTVSPDPILNAIQRQATGTFGRQINAAPDVNAIESVAQSFQANPHLPRTAQGDLAPIPASLAHEFASNTGTNLRGKFGRLGGATVEAEKAAREAITSQLRNGIPALEPLWANEARQITVRDALEKALARTANRDPIGIGGIIGAVKNPALALTAMADRSAVAKSMLANGLYGMTGPTTLAPDLVRAAILARLTAAQNAQGGQ